VPAPDVDFPRGPRRGISQGMLSLSSPSQIVPTPLSGANVAEIDSQGFTYIANICEESELDILRDTLGRLFREHLGAKEGAYYDMLEDESQGSPRSPTIVRPSNYAPELRDLPCRQRAAAIARHLLGDDAVLAFEHAILKPALFGAPTPWHQDEAYRREPDFHYNQLSFWMPLDDAGVESGCLHYVPGSNLGAVLPHRSYNNDSRTYALECSEPVAPDLGRPLPVKAGDCALHSGRTLHYAGPNRTAAPRCAYILEFEVPPRPLAAAREFPWHRDRLPPNRVIRGRWLRRGGVIIEILRRLREETLFRPARLRFELRRCFRALRSYL
jgi:ectoine hydroxylase-related dioxygenase (phytanoyl-CoA dioxygenase family)